MNEHLLKAIAAAYESGGALARFADEPDVKVKCMDSEDRRYAESLRDHLKKMDDVLDALINPYVIDDEAVGAPPVASRCKRTWTRSSRRMAILLDRRFRDG